MGFWSSLKKIFSLSGEDEAELEELRAKHGIDAKSKDEILQEIKNDPRSPDYDPWEEIRNVRTNFYFGSWLTKKYRFHPIGEEKLKKDLERLTKKREEEEKRKRGEA